MDWKIFSLGGLVGLGLVACSEPKAADAPDSATVEGGCDDAGGHQPVDSGNPPPDQGVADAGADSEPDATGAGGTDATDADGGADAERGPDADGGADANGGPDAEGGTDADRGPDVVTDAGFDASSEGGPTDDQLRMMYPDAYAVMDSSEAATGNGGMGGYVSNPGNTIVTATSSNTGGDSTTFPVFSSAQAIVTVTQNFNPNNGRGAYNDHNVGVWYTGTQWAVFNEDTASMPVGASFNTNITDADSNHFMAGSCTGCLGGTIGTGSMQIPETGNYTVMIVTPVWNPAGSSGAYHNHPVGLYYDGSAWWVYNEDQATMPSDVAFAVRVASASDDAYIHVSSASNTHGDYTILDRPSLNGHPEAMVFVTHVYDTPSVPTALHNHPVGVWYTGSNWAVFNEDLAPMPTGVVFNVMVAPPAQ